MVRRLGTLAVVAALTVAGLAPVAAAQATDDTPDGFSDVTGGVHKPAIDALDELGVFDGTECGQQQFCPGEEMKRWTMAVWLVRVLDEQEPPAVGESSFADVDFEKWWLPHVERLAELGVTDGCLVDPLRFCPDQPVTRAEMATFLFRAFELEAADPAGFADTGNHFHEANIDALAAARITAGCATGPRRYCPEKPVTRAEMATFLARALGLVELPAVTKPTDRPGEGVHVVAARANWASGYFQAELHRLLLQELGYTVSDPAENELGPRDAYTAMALGEVDYWPNSWYPGHLAWLEVELPGGSRVGDRISAVGEQMAPGSLQGFLIEKSFADTHGVYTMDELNRNAAALAAFDADDPIPGNGKADIYGCAENWACDNIIENMIAFSGWDNIAQIVANYDWMFNEARERVAAGSPTIMYTWTPSAYITVLRPGENVYWMGVDEVLDDSNPANQPEGESHDQRGLGRSGGNVAVGADQCPSADDQPSGLCRIGWLSSDILVTANNDFLAANPAAKALFEAVKLPVVDVSDANVGVNEGRSPRDLAAGWIADNRGLVDRWLDAARAADPDPTDATADTTDPPTRAGADPAACRPPGVGDGDVTAGFPLPAWASPSTGTFRVAVLFMDFSDAVAAHSTRDESALGLPYAETYLEAVSYGKLDVEFVPLHRWLRAPNDFGHYLGERAIGERRVDPSFDAIRLADPSFNFNGIHTVMTVLPSTRFSAGGHLTAAVRTDEKLIRSMAQINTAPLSEAVEPSEWGTVAAHELGHAMGLLDLYPYNVELFELPESTDTVTWVRSEFGLMGLQASFAAEPMDGRFLVDWNLPGGGRGYSFTTYAAAGEMLAWSRWQLGWLDESQVLCINTDSARVMLGPVADPGGAAAMAVVPLSDTEMLVIESRRQIGYDAEEERTVSDGSEVMIPTLAVEGALVYTVDASVHSGELPMRLPGDSGDLRIDDYPIIAVGSRIFVAGYTIGVAPDRDGTHVVRITKGRR